MVNRTGRGCLCGATSLRSTEPLCATQKNDQGHTGGEEGQTRQCRGEGEGEIKQVGSNELTRRRNAAAFTYTRVSSDSG